MKKSLIGLVLFVFAVTACSSGIAIDIEEFELEEGKMLVEMSPGWYVVTDEEDEEYEDAERTDVSLEDLLDEDGDIVDTGEIDWGDVDAGDTSTLEAFLENEGFDSGDIQWDELSSDPIEDAGLEELMDPDGPVDTGEEGDGEEDTGEEESEDEESEDESEEDLGEVMWTGHIKGGVRGFSKRDHGVHMSIVGGTFEGYIYVYETGTVSGYINVLNSTNYQSEGSCLTHSILSSCELIGITNGVYNISGRLVKSDGYELSHESSSEANPKWPYGEDIWMSFSIYRYTSPSEIMLTTSHFGGDTEQVRDLGLESAFYAGRLLERHYVSPWENDTLHLTYSIDSMFADSDVHFIISSE